MNIQHKDFIGIYEGAIPQETCANVINEFEKVWASNPASVQAGHTQFNSEKLGRMDYSIFAERILPDVANVINTSLNQCLQFYAQEYFSLKDIQAKSFVVKLQKTPPRGGYHVWHAETFNRNTMERVLAWMVYLNDIPDGEGETEFLWQGMRVKPKAGTCVIWPSQFTHPHRGNPVYSCDKYIATGWYTYTD